MRAVSKRRWADLTPWNELEGFGGRMRRWMDYPPFGMSLLRTPLLSEAAGWLPAVELIEADHEFVLTAEIPGMVKDDVDVFVEDNILTLKGEKKVEHEEEHDRMHIHEREYGSFERCFTLPRNVDVERIKAEYHDGIVEVHLPKGEEAKGRHIQIT